LTTFSSTQKNGVIKSPNYPRNYCDDLTCTHAIKRGRPGTGIKLKFDAFATEAGSDNVFISFIQGQTSQRLAKLSGNLGNALPKYVISEGGLEVVFQTDGSVTQSGWKATFNRFNISEVHCACPGFLHWATQTPVDILSPNYPQPYCHDIECFYLLKARHPNSVQLTLNKDDFQLEQRYDSLEVYDGNVTTDAAKLAKLSGSLNETKTFTSRSNTMMLVFRSDGSTAHKGFRGSIKQVKGPCHCDETTALRGDSGQIVSPHFGKGYCADMNCSWSVEVGTGKRVQFELTHFNMRSSDFVAVYKTGAMNPLMKFRGSRDSRDVFTVDGTKATLRMITSSNPGFSSNREVGFNLTYRAIDTNNCGCPGANPQNITGGEGSLRQAACGPLDCYWLLLRPNADSRLLSVTVHTLNIDGEDYLRISQGTFTPRGWPDVSKSYTGHLANLPEHIVSFAPTDTTTPVMIHLHTRDAAPVPTGSGFELRYKWHIQNCSCGSLRLTAQNETRQFLTTPGFPTPYCNKMNCKWVISAPAGYRVVVNVTALKTESGSHDNLGIYDGTHTNGPNRLGLMYDDIANYATRVFRSNQTTMTIWFTTDGSVVYSGWNLTYYYELNVRPAPVLPGGVTGFQPIPGYQPITCPPSAAAAASGRGSRGGGGDGAPSEKIVFAVHGSYEYAFFAGFGVGILVTALICCAIFFCFQTGKCQRLKPPVVVYKRQSNNGIDSMYLEEEPEKQ
jgi:hypothetical protein